MAVAPQRLSSRRLLPVVALLVALAAGVPTDAAASEASAGPYRPPVLGAVLRPFEPPATTFGPGHRGVDLDAVPGEPVVAAAAGTVRHAGAVAGTVWVSVAHGDGIVTSYGPLTELTVRRGQAVTGGQDLGRLASGGHGGGADERGLHFGARRGRDYLDPLSLLTAAAPRPSLVGPGGWQVVGVPAVDPPRPPRTR